MKFYIPLFISTLTLPVVNLNYILNQQRKDVEEDVNSNIEIFQENRPGSSELSDVKPLKNLIELDPSLSFDTLKKEISTIKLEGNFKLQTAIISKSYELLELNLDIQDDIIMASFYDEIIINTPEFNQLCNIAIDVKIDQKLNIEVSNYVMVNSLFGDKKVMSLSNINTLKIIY